MKINELINAVTKDYIPIKKKIMEQRHQMQIKPKKE